MNIRDIPQELLDRLNTMEHDDAWPPLEEIKRELPIVMRVTSAMMPPTLRPWLADIAERMQCPLDFVAVGALVGIGSIVGTGCAVRPKAHDDWTEVPNLWGGVVGEPGAMKTPALTEALRPLRILEDAAKVQYDADTRQYQLAALNHKLQQDMIKQQIMTLAKQQAKGGGAAQQSLALGPPPATLSQLQAQLFGLQPPSEPQLRRYRTNDPTVEKLLELMRDNHRGLLLFRDELSGLLADLDREEKASARAFHLEGWNGQNSYTSDRIGRGTIHADRVCESWLGGIQPGKLEAYLAAAIGGYDNDGLVQRLQLLVYPDQKTTFKLVDRQPDYPGRDKACQLICALADVDFVALGATDDGTCRVPYFRFEPQAQTAFNRWLIKLETQLRTDEADILRQHFSKYRKLMPCLALIFHLLDRVQKYDPKVHPLHVKSAPIPLASVKMAIKWCEYLESHARRVYGLSIDPVYSAATRLASKIERGEVADGFKARELYRKGWTGLTDPEHVQRALRELQDAGWVREIRPPPKAQGRPAAPSFQIRPEVAGRNK